MTSCNFSFSFLKCFLKLNHFTRLSLRDISREPERRTLVRKKWQRTQSQRFLLLNT